MLLRGTRRLLVEIESFTLIFTDTERSLTHQEAGQSFVNQLSVWQINETSHGAKPQLMGDAVTGMTNRPANGDHDTVTSWVTINNAGETVRGIYCSPVSK